MFVSQSSLGSRKLHHAASGVRPAFQRHARMISASSLSEYRKRRGSGESTNPATKLRLFLDSANINQWELWFSTGMFYGGSGMHGTHPLGGSVDSSARCGPFCQHFNATGLPLWGCFCRLHHQPLYFAKGQGSLQHQELDKSSKNGMCTSPKLHPAQPTTSKQPHLCSYLLKIMKSD